MHILKLCHEFPPIGGGAAAVCAALGREYVKQGHEVDVVTMAHSDLRQLADVDGMRVHRVACGRRRVEMASPLEGLLWAHRTKPLIDRLHRESPVDAIHAHFIMPAGIPAVWLGRNHSIPVIVTPHGSDVPGYNRERLKLAHIVVQPWWKHICRAIDQIVSPSHDLLALIRQSCAIDHARVIPNGFEPGRFAPLEKEPRILLCSRLVERKGFHRFLKAIAEEELEQWEIDIVGDGPMRLELRELAKACRARVNFHGWLDNDSQLLKELYGRASIFVLPSERENFSIALLEAMSAGCAVVTTDVSGNPEVIGDCGILVPPLDEGALRTTLLELISDQQRCLSLGHRGQQRVLTQFTWQRLSVDYLDLMDRLRVEKRQTKRPATVT